MKINFFKNIFSKKSIAGAGISAIMSSFNNSVGNRYRRWVFACITAIAKGIAQTDWELAQVTSKGVNKIDSHELLSLLYKFNPKTTKYNSLYLTVVYFLKDGEVAWILDRPEGRVKPTGIFVVPTSTLQVTKKNEDGTPAMYKFTVGAKTQTIPADLVKFFINPDPDNPTRGLSTITAMEDVIDNDTKQVRWNKSLLDNSAVPSGNIEVTGSLEPKQAKMLREQYTDLHAGFEKTGKVGILTNGAKFVSSGIAPKDMEFVEGRKMNREEILALFGVPPIILGLGGDYNRATSETAERMFAKYTLQPIMTMLVEQINLFVTPLFGQGLLVGFEEFDVVDSEQKLNEQKEGWNKWLTTNEIREENGLPALIGGDNIYVPLNLVPSVGGEKEVKTLIGGKRGDFSIKKEAQIKKLVKSRDFILNEKSKLLADSITNKILKQEKKLVLKISKGMDDEKKNEIWEKAIAVKKIVEKSFIAKLDRLFEEQKQLVKENLGLQEKAVDDDPFDLEKQIESTISIIEPEYYFALREGGKIASEISGIEFVDPTSLPSVQEWARKLSEKYATDITEVTFERTLTTIGQGVNEGLGATELAKSIDDLFDNMKETRSITIARTESARALTAGQAFEWENAGLTELEWKAEGNDPCPICTGLDGQEFPIKETLNGTIEHSHPNCECIFLPL